MRSSAAMAKRQHDEAVHFDHIGWENRAKFHWSLFESELKKAVSVGVNSDGDGWAYQFGDGSKLVIFAHSDDSGDTYAINAWRREDREWFQIVMEDAGAIPRPA